MQSVKSITFLFLVFMIISCSFSKNHTENDSEKKDLLSYDKSWDVFYIDEIEEISSGEVSLIFVEDKINGKSFCNNYFGSFTEENNVIKMNPIGATKKACPSLVNENIYFKKLQETVKREVKYNQPNYILFLYDENGKVIIKGKSIPTIK